MRKKEMIKRIEKLEQQNRESYILVEKLDYDDNGCNIRFPQDCKMMSLKKAVEEIINCFDLKYKSKKTKSSCLVVGKK